MFESLGSLESISNATFAIDYCKNFTLKQNLLNFIFKTKGNKSMSTVLKVKRKLECKICVCFFQGSNISGTKVVFVDTG